MDKKLKNIVKSDFIKLAEHHKAHCEGEKCTISLYTLKLVLEELDIKLTDEEVLVFM